MPVTTPDALVTHYGKDQEHFSHVLDHLFVPAIEKAAFDPIRPIAQGPPDLDAVKTVIQGHIKLLGELIEKETTSARAARARDIQVRYKTLLSKK